MAYNQNQQWPGELPRKYYAVILLFLNLCNKNIIAIPIFKMRQIAYSLIEDLSYEYLQIIV